VGLEVVMLTLILGVALAQAPDPALTCLTPAEVEARILDPLHRLIRCQREVEVHELSAVGYEAALRHAADETERARAAEAVADRRRRRADRRAAVAGPSGAVVGALVVILLVLL
jgi:hypothetical protein